MKTPLILKNRFVAAAIVGIVVMVAMLTVAAGWACYIDPVKMPLAGILTLAYGAILIANVVVTVFVAFFSRRLMVVGIAAIVLTLQSALEFCPLNVNGLITPTLTPTEQQSAFTLMSFNAHDFEPANGEYLPNGDNPFYEYFLEKDPDIIVIQEIEVVGPYEPWHLKKHQVDALLERYPHSEAHYRQGVNLAVFSKFPFEVLWFKAHNGYYAQSQAVNVTLPDGREFTIINVHLQSLGLTMADKALYTDVLKASADRKELSKLRGKVFRKLGRAFKQRAAQADTIRQMILTDPRIKENLIVTGDFNDVQNCWSVRHVCDGTRLRSVYRNVGFGPLITYYYSKMYFRIDHTLYRGDLKPLYYDCDQTFRYSDHFPVMMEFLLEAK
ncbi:MAG: endonuclease/exonuclease/phosphatase family protein [Muribaculaceae bacterium]|nr:endonuclease/exonuclease/phosphatase family protein [Muribaculaceae bacterium]